MDRQDAVVSARVPIQLKQLITQFIQQDTHLNESDLIRDALREKIRREAPSLYEQLFRRATNE